MSLSFALASLEAVSFDGGSAKLSIPNIRLENKGPAVSGFAVLYYFSAADTKDIVADPYYLAGGNLAVEKLSGNQYVAALGFAYATLDSGESFPGDGFLQFGIHYSDWSDWKSDDDYSNGSGQTSGGRIVVISSAGTVLAGNFPNEDDLILEPSLVKIYAKSQSERNYGKYLVYAKNEGNVPVTRFDFDVEIRAERGNVPIVEGWYLPNATVNLEKKDSGLWVLHFSVQDVNLEPGGIYPGEPGFSFGVHYGDWAAFDPSDDYSLAEVGAEYAENGKIPVYVDGRLVFGNPKIHDLEDVKRIVAAENGWTEAKLEEDIDSATVVQYIPKISLEKFLEDSESFFENTPDYDSTEKAFSWILDKYPGMDSLFLVQRFKDIKAVYEQLVRIKAMEYAEDELLKSRIVKKISRSYNISGNDLTSGEFWAMVKHPMRIPGARRSLKYARKWTEQYAENRGFINGNEKVIDQDNQADGFRHSVWNALLCRESGTQFDDVSECLNWAKRISNAHEEGNSMDLLSTQMDFHNNRVGRDIARQYLKVGCEWRIFGVCINEEVKGLSRERAKEEYEKETDRGLAFNDTNQLKRLPWYSRISFFRNGKGKYYCLPNQESSGCIAFEEPSAKEKRIGVLKADSTIVCEEEISITLDMEDDDRDAGIQEGFQNPPGIQILSGRVTFTYCVLLADGEAGAIPQVPYDYAVLRLDDDCPVGTYAFRRHHDTEDDNNKNSYEGEISPNLVKSNADLEYCFVPADSLSALEYPFDETYGIFAAESSAVLRHSKIKVDDEDSDNANSWKWYSAPEEIQSRIENIVNGGSNTIYHVVRWVKMTLAVLLEAK